jgi:hypothetical protein
MNNWSGGLCRKPNSSRKLPIPVAGWSVKPPCHLFRNDHRFLSAWPRCILYKNRCLSITLKCLSQPNSASSLAMIASREGNTANFFCGRHVSFILFFRRNSRERDQFSANRAMGSDLCNIGNYSMDNPLDPSHLKHLVCRFLVRYNVRKKYSK